MQRSRNREVRDLFQHGISVHHAGMLRSDRTMVEQLFSKGLIRVLCCTATLAWGVNLPAHAVVIKGTQLYNAKVGNFIDLGILDVLQVGFIFYIFISSLIFDLEFLIYDNL